MRNAALRLWRSVKCTGSIRHSQSHGALVAGRDLLGRCAVGAGQLDEDGLPVVPQLFDRFLDIRQCAVVARLRGRLVVDARIPAPDKFLDAGHVDVSIVHVALELGHVPGKERAIGMDGVAREGRLPWLWNEMANIIQHALLGLSHREAAVEGSEQSRCRMHGADEVAHLVDRLGTGLDHDVDTVTENLQLSVGDEHGNLDEGVGGQIQSGHLAVNPDQEFAHGHTLWFLTSTMIMVNSRLSLSLSLSLSLTLASADAAVEPPTVVPT